MIRAFANQGAEDIFDGRDTKAARRTCPRSLWPVARRRLDALNFASSLLDLRQFGLEKLKGNREGQHSIRINIQYRVCFRWVTPDAFEVEIVDYHS